MKQIQLQEPETKSDTATVSEIKKQSGHKVKYHNIIITLLALLVMPVYLYGLRVLVLMAVGLATALAVDIICIKLFMRDKWLKYDYSSEVTALITVMLLPATVPAWVVCVSVALGICVAKYPFGGAGHNIFNPAAVGVAFSAICWPELVMRYPVPYTTYALADISKVQYALSPASVLRVGGTPKIDYFDILLGKFAGPIGATCMIVLVACMFYLAFRKVISKRIIFSAFVVVAIFALLFPRVITGRISSLVFELSSGVLVFGIIFMATDPATTPKTKNGRLFYGALLGFLIMMFRYFGKVELEFVYAILIANVFAGSCDRYANHLSAKFGKKPHHRIHDTVMNPENEPVETGGESNA